MIKISDTYDDATSLNHIHVHLSFPFQMNQMNQIRLLR